MSTPAAKAFSLPVMTMQPMAGSVSNVFERAVELADEERVQRVQRVRPVERDEPDLALARDNERLVGAVLSGASFALCDLFDIHVVQFPYL